MLKRPQDFDSSMFLKELSGLLASVYYSPEEMQVLFLCVSFVLRGLRGQ